MIGYPNVGKSTLVNRLSGTREAVTHAEPGVTRDRKEVPAEWNGVAFSLVDTGGVDLTERESLAAPGAGPGAQSLWRTRRRRCWSWTRRPACDPATRSSGDILRRSGVPAIVVANKLDRGADAPLAAEFHGLGLGEPDAGLGGTRHRDRRPARPRRGRGARARAGRRRKRTRTRSASR